MTNEYYILPVALIDKVDNEEVVEDRSSVRYNNSGTHFVCKTKIGVENAPFMNPNTAYTHEEIKVEMLKPTWTESL